MANEAATNHATDLDGAAALHACPARKPRILLADDDHALRGMMAALLKREGFEVVQATDGSDLVDHLAATLLRVKAAPFDLVISDIRMPGVSGLEVLEGMRESDDFPPMVLITAFGSPEVHETARRLGAAILLDKPISLDALVEAARRYVRRPPAP